MRVLTSSMAAVGGLGAQQSEAEMERSLREIEKVAASLRAKLARIHSRREASANTLCPSVAH